MTEAEAAISTAHANWALFWVTSFAAIATFAAVLTALWTQRQEWRHQRARELGQRLQEARRGLEVYRRAANFVREVEAWRPDGLWNTYTVPKLALSARAPEHVRAVGNMIASSTLDLEVFYCLTAVQESLDESVRVLRADTGSLSAFQIGEILDRFKVVNLRLTQLEPEIERLAALFQGP